MIYADFESILVPQYKCPVQTNIKKVFLAVMTQWWKV